MSPQSTQALYPVYCEAILYSIYILSVYTAHCVANVIVNYFTSFKEKERKEKMFIQIKNIWYYNVYIHKLRLSIKYFNLNITVTSHAEKVSVFTRQISDTRLSLLW